jgi:ATP-binding cassette subfamily B protein
MVGASMLYEILDQPIDTAEARNATTLSVSDGRITFKNVSFSYNNSPALKNISLDIQPCAVTALVGPSGGGKTTVFALIERFYDPASGTIEIDGQDLRYVSFESLRENIALVTQDTFLFDGTVRENIAFGKADASDDDIRQAAENANAHEFITELEYGYDTQLGEDGGRLSGGQRQRIAIARAMLRNAPILILDEPTSALDAQSEHKVQEALDRLMKNRTTIVIAHRLSTVRNADVIYVMEKGRVLQSGSHATLINEGGLYSHLCALQFKEPTTRLDASAH